MTFYYDEDKNELVGNNAFDEDLGFAAQDDDTLRMDVDQIMEEGRGLRKLRGMQSAVESAIEANGGDEGGD